MELRRDSGLFLFVDVVFGGVVEILVGVGKVPGHVGVV
ncbi:MAG: hypothetical protein ACI8V2_004790 [Candidatus Latescibacterota bacterium]|jgi:hypothetical protein